MCTASAVVSQRGVRALALICLVAACDAGENKQAPPPPKPSTITTVTGADLSYLPADADIVVQVDVKTLRQSKLWPAYEGDVAKLLAPGFAHCDYKPLTDATSVVIGIPIKAKLGVFVIRGIDRSKAEHCMTAQNEHGNRGVTIITPSGVDVMTFVDATTLVVQHSKQATKELPLQATAPLAHDPEIVASLERLPAKAAVTVVSRVGSKQVDAEWASLGMHLKYFYGSMTATDRLQMRFAMAMRSPDEAKQIEKLMTDQLATTQVKQMFDGIGAVAQGDTVTLDIGISEPKLGSLIGMMRALMPAD
jgi:hypothetical protein